MEIYGAAVADKLDNNKGILKRRYYRQVSWFLYSVCCATAFNKENNRTANKQLLKICVSFSLIVYQRIGDLWFQHCNLDFGSYTKDLSAISDDLSSIFILDNSPGAYRSYPGKVCFWLSVSKIIYLESTYITSESSFKDSLISRWIANLLDATVFNVLFFRQCNSNQVVVLRSNGHSTVKLVADVRCSQVRFRCTLTTQSELTSTSVVALAKGDLVSRHNHNSSTLPENQTVMVYS